MNARSFVQKCVEAYDNSGLCDEDLTEKAIQKAASRLKDVDSSSIVYKRIYEEFVDVLYWYGDRVDGEKECRYYGLNKPTKDFQLYRKICDWTDTKLLDRIYFEISARWHHASEQYTSLFTMPKDSWMKAAKLAMIVPTLPEFDEAYLFYSEALTAWIEDGWVDRDTKIIIDNLRVSKYFLNTNDKDKYRIVSKYIKQPVVNWYGDAPKYINGLKFGKAHRFFYINGAFYHSQRPALVNQIKELSPNSVVIMVLLNLYNYGRQRNMDAHWNELESWGIKKYYGFECVQEAFTKLCNYPVNFYRYDQDSKQEKCLVVV